PHNSHVVPFLLIYSLTCSSIPRPARSTPFPYTTLFRSRDDPHRREVEVLGDSSRDDLRQVLGGGIHREEDELLLVFEESVAEGIDRKSTRLNSSHVKISYAVFCLKKKKRESSQVEGWSR